MNDLAIQINDQDEPEIDCFVDRMVEFFNVSHTHVASIFVVECFASSFAKICDFRRRFSDST